TVVRLEAVARALRLPFSAFLLEKKLDTLVRIHRGQTRATNFLALRLPLLTAAVAKPRNFEFEFAGASFGFLCAATTLDNGALATADLPNWRLFVFVADRRLVVLLAILFVVLLFVIRTFVIGIVVGGFQLVVTLKLRIFAILF